MANHKQALKRQRQTAKRAARNHYYVSTLRSQLKAARTDLDEGNKEAASTSVAEVSRYLDRVASRGVIHRNRANRLKSRLSRRLAAL